MSFLLLITVYLHAMVLYYTQYWLEEKLFAFHVKVFLAVLLGSA